MAEIRLDSRGQHSMNFAGDTYNTAVYCARELRSPESVAYYTRIGCDAVSQSFLDTAKKEQLDLSFIGRDKSRNIGIYAISTTDEGERSFDYWRENSAARRVFSGSVPNPELPDAQVIYVSGITLAVMEPEARFCLLDSLRKRSETGQSLIAFDSNYRPVLWENESTARDVISKAWSIADIALPSVDDEMNLFEDESEEAVIERFRAKEWYSSAIKRGAAGPISPQLSQLEHPTFRPATNVVDTTAAGDSFNGAYLAALIYERSLQDCMIAGHQLARRVVGQQGAIVQ